MELLGSLEKRRPRLRAKINSPMPFSQIIATGLGVGYLPKAPGSWGSLFAALILWVLYQLPVASPLLIHLLLVAALAPVAWLTASRASRSMGEPDPSVVVIDEILGMMLSMLVVPVSWISLIMGFALFRLFDILKPPPVRQCERLKGGLGIVMDDVVAGIYSAVGLWLIHAL